MPESTKLSVLLEEVREDLQDSNVLFSELLNYVASDHVGLINGQIDRNHNTICWLNRRLP